jgi:pilus assembly protein CpaF
MSPNFKNRLQKEIYKFVIQWIQNSNVKNPSKNDIEKQCHLFLEKHNWLLPTKTIEFLISQIQFSILGLGPLETFLQDESVSEIMVNGPDIIFVERYGKLEKTPFSFLNETHLLEVIQQIVEQVGRRIDEKTPFVDARLPDGSRVNAIIAPLSLKGPILTIRKFPKKIFGIQELIANQTCSPKMAKFISICIKEKKNMIISGGTGTGKTSTLNAFATLISNEERLVTIEDSAEINIIHPNLISLESRCANIENEGVVNVRQLLKNALRMRPDRIIVGEIRGEEALDMLQAMNTGHKGSLTTVHANSPLESLFRIETMVLMGSIDLPISAIRPQVIQALDIVIQQERLSSGERKIVSIAEIQKNSKPDKYSLKELFKYDKKNGNFRIPLT